MPEESKPNPEWAHAYQTSVNLAIHSQEQRWQPFAAYLVFNSILILGWVTIFTVENHREWHLLAQFLLCLTGVIVAVVWISLAVDYTRSNRQAWADAARIEQKFYPNLPDMQTIGKRQPQVKGQGYRVILFISITLMASYFVLGALSYVAWANNRDIPTSFPYQEMLQIMRIVLGGLLFWLAYRIINVVLMKEKPEPYEKIAAPIASGVFVVLGVAVLYL